MKVLAFDLGVSSGRDAITELKVSKITRNERHRFASDGVNIRGILFWEFYIFMTRLSRA